MLKNAIENLPCGWICVLSLAVAAASGRSSSAQWSPWNNTIFGRNQEQNWTSIPKQGQEFVLSILYKWNSSKNCACPSSFGKRDACGYWNGNPFTTNPRQPSSMPRWIVPESWRVDLASKIPPWSTKDLLIHCPFVNESENAHLCVCVGVCNLPFGGKKRFKKDQPPWLTLF